MKVLTGEMLREIRDSLVENGYDCAIRSGANNDATLNLVWSCADDDCAMDIIFSVIRDVCHGINIRYVSGGVCHAKLAVNY